MTQIDRHPELFVEIGFGTNPAALAGSRTFNDDRAYFGIDAAKGKYDHVATGNEYGQEVARCMADLAMRASSERPNENIEFALGDGRNLPQDDNSVDELYMANVLTAPMAGADRARRELLQEATRVLKDNGKLVVKVSWDAWLDTPEYISSKISRAGLTVTQVIEDTDEKFKVLEDEYGKSEGIDKPTGYFVIAEKLPLD